MDHLIERKTVASLLDGRKFVIPSYQRGYRWTVEQVDELLDDFLTYVYDKSDKGFYCLQPVIVQKHDDAWELVDGQQRITTLLILMKALFKLENYTKEDAFSDAYGGKKLMTLTFETHPEDDDFLANIVSKTSDAAKNINQVHMYAAFCEIERWFKEDAPRKCGIKSVRKIADAFLDILATVDDTADEDHKNIQIIWYALDNGEEVNPIKEFLRINSGKIPLTDAELVKALLLQKSNFEYDEAKQIQHALEWETMENTLNHPDFWGMLSSNAKEIDRMRIILDMIYRAGNNGAGPKEKGDMFRFFTGVVADKSAAELWKSVVDRFRLLETWFEDPLVHNYVGLLSHYDETIYSIMKLYDDLPPDSDRRAFVMELIRKVQEYLKKVKLDNGKISLSYERDGDLPLIRKLLLFLNVAQSNHRVEELEKAAEDVKESWECRDAGFFKFPFSLYDAQNWNVEHVDSYTENNLKDSVEQKVWITKAKECYPVLANDNQAIALENEENYSALIDHIKRTYDCGEEPPEVKGSIGNLVLLDEKTNKGYGNHVFAVKSSIIKKKVHDGVFVPLCTQWVFEKTLEGCDSSDKLKWNVNNKIKYHDFIVKELSDFLAITKEEK